jgi:hypothetical protein
MLRRFRSFVCCDDKSWRLLANGVRHRLRVRLHRALLRHGEHYETRHRGLLRHAERHGTHREVRYRAPLLHGHLHDWLHNRVRFHDRRRTFLRHRR